MLSLSARFSMAGLFLAIACLLAPAPSTAQPIEAAPQTARLHAGASATQTVSLVPGVNLVSLYVLPDNPSLDVLLGGVAEYVDAVSGDDGRAYAPQHGVMSLSTWEGGRSYRIFVAPDAPETLSFNVVGARLETETELILERGWNELAFLYPSPLPVDVALVSVAESLNRIESVDKRVYPASGNRPVLTTLDPGQGYRIHLSRRDTLVLAEAVGSVAGDRQVDTIADALALEGLQVGEVVEVAGHAEPGDGGGGRFEVVDTGEAPDGGGVFVPYEFTEETTATGLDRSQSLFAGEGIAFESFRLYYGPEAEDYYTATDLHGHGGDADGRRFFDPATGDLTVPYGALSLAEERTGVKRVSVRYRYATGPIRLKRIVPAIRLEGALTDRYVRPEWWGALPYPTDWTPDASAPSSPGARPSGITVGDPDYDATNTVATALNAAAALAEAEGQDYYVVLKGMYGYARMLETQDGAVLKGERDDIRDGQGLRALKGAPWRRFALDEAVDTRYAVERSIHDQILAGGKTPQVVIRHGRRTTLGRIVDLEIDGNITENAYVFSDEYVAASGPANQSNWSNRLEQLLQNSTHWNGFVATTAKRDGVVGSNARLENVHLHDFGGNLMLGAASTTHFGGSRDLRLGNSARNHGMYRVWTAEGTFIDGIEVYGFWWNGFIPMQMGNYRGVTVRDIVPNPYFGYLGNFLGHRNGATEDELGDPETDFYFGERTVIEDLRVEFPDGVRFTTAKYDRGPYALRGLTIVARGDEPALVMGLQGDLYNQTERSHYEITDVDIEEGSAYGFMAGTAMRADARRLTLSAEDSPGSSYSPFEVRPHAAGHVYTIYDVRPEEGKAPYRADGLFVVNPSDDADVSMDLFVQRVNLEADRDVVAIKKIDPDAADIQERYRIFFRDAQFDRFNLYNSALGVRKYGYKLCYFDDVTVGSKTSEETGTLSNTTLQTSGDGTGYVDIQANLFHRPYEAEDGGGGLVELTGGAASRYQGYENVGTQSDPVLRLRFSGTSPVSGTWSAAVRPIPAGVVFPE